MNQTATYAPNRRSRPFAICLCLLLGCIGGHLFYLGRSGWGLAYLLFCWTLIPFIVSLFDLLALLMQSDQQFDQYYNG